LTKKKQKKHYHRDSQKTGLVWKEAEAAVFDRQLTVVSEYGQTHQFGCGLNQG